MLTKDLSKAFRRIQFYNDILLELADSKFFSLIEAKSGYCHARSTGQRSSLPKTFNAPWGKYLWLRLSFGLTVEGDMFQECPQ